MISKMYEKITKFIKEEYRFILFLVLILFIGLYKLPYNLYTGGGIINVYDRISVEDEYKELGSFNLAYVSQTRATIPTFLLSYIFGWDRESIESVRLSDEDTFEDMWARDRMYLKEANDNAIISAYKLANENITFKSKLYSILYIGDSVKNKTDLKVGDTLLSIDDVRIDTDDDISKLIDNKNVGDKIKVVVLREGKEVSCTSEIVETDGVKRVGLVLIRNYDYETDREVKIKYSSSEGGPSGGFMTSLTIYNRLTSDDLTKGLKIVGTGTIDYEGNVGEIGGVKYKLKGAVSNKADVFFVPVDNYEEAMEEKEKHNYKIDIIKVEKLVDAINYLESR